MTRLLSALLIAFWAIFTVSAFGQIKAPPAAAGKTASKGAGGNLSPIIEPGTAAPAPGQPSAVASPAAAAQANLAPLPQQPEWAACMTPEEQKWVDDVLRYWESRSDKIKLFECKFQKWDYDNGFLDPTNGQRSARTYAEGSIKYAQPDKGLFHVERLVSILPPNQPGGQVQKVEQSAELGEHWICDGNKIYSFEANKKQVTVTPLPAEMRGKAIADGPLPFMFGAQAETIKARYWIHGLGDGPPGKYKLEAVPKSREDAQNFKSVIIILDQKDYLPESLQIFAPNYDPPRNDARQTYVFPAENRVAKDEATLKDMIAKNLLGVFYREFYEPKIPTGWKKVEQNPVANVPLGPAPPPQQAAPPNRNAPTVR